MQVEEPVRGTTQKRTVKWLFEELDTLRRTIVARAGRLTRPQGKLTLTLNANPIVQDALLRFPRQNQRLQTHLGKKTLGVNPAVKGQGARGGFGLGGRPLPSTEPSAPDSRAEPRGDPVLRPQCHQIGNLPSHAPERSGPLSARHRLYCSPVFPAPGQSG